MQPHLDVVLRVEAPDGTGRALPAILDIPREPLGLVVFAHGSGSSRHSPRNAAVAVALNGRGLATCRLDLLTEGEAEDRALVFDISLLSSRLVAAVREVSEMSGVRNLPVGLFGASTGAAAALVAASRMPELVSAVVSRGGRPDLANDVLSEVRVPVLLVVGGEDHDVLALNRAAARALAGPVQLAVVEGAGHLFEEPGALDEVARLAGDWFLEHVGVTRKAPERLPFRDRDDAGRRLAAALLAFRSTNPVVYGLPRGGLPVAARVAEALGAPLDVILVRKLGVPGQEELAFGALVDGDAAEVVLNHDIVDLAGLREAAISGIVSREEAELKRRAGIYLKGRPQVDPSGRTAIIVDDGLATGATAAAAVRGLRRRGAGRVVVAAPVASPEAAARLEQYADDVICLVTPRMFSGVGAFYEDFHQLGDEDVVAILDAAAAFPDAG